MQGCGDAGGRGGSLEVKKAKGGAGWSKRVPHRVTCGTIARGPTGHGEERATGIPASGSDPRVREEREIGAPQRSAQEAGGDAG